MFLGVCMTFGERLKELRNNAGLTIRGLAETIGIPTSTLSNYEQDYRRPDFETLLRLSEFYSVSTDYLLGKTNNPKSGVSLAQELKKLRAQLGLTQEEFAERTKIASDAIKAIEAGFESNALEEVKAKIIQTILSKEKGGKVIPLAQMKRVPVLGRVCAGNGYPAKEEILGYVLDPKGSSDFALQVEGDSMAPRYNDGDIVYVKNQKFAESGQYVVAYVNGEEAMLRRYIYQEVGKIVILEPENKKYDKTILILRDNPSWGIIGIVTGRFVVETHD